MSPETIHSLVEGVVAVVTAYVGGSQFANRRKGKERDDSRDANTAATQALAAKVELGMKEVSSQVAAYGQTLWTVQADLKVAVNRISVVERELERERDRADRIETRFRPT